MLVASVTDGKGKLTYTPGSLHMMYGCRASILDITSRKSGPVKSFEAISGDIRALQADLKNRRALFQVASNFHAFEQPSHDSSPEQTSLEDYVHDNTQGPAAVIGTMADLVYRRYKLPEGPYTDKALESGEWSLDMLATVRRLYGVNIEVGGWADITKAKRLTTITDVLTAASLVASVFVESALVTHDEKLRFVGDKDHRIHQVLVSAYDMTRGTGTHAENWAFAFLIAAYVNTLLAANTIGTKKIYLTSVGGGVFGNSAKSIYKAIAIAINSVPLGPDVSIFLVGWPNVPKGTEKLKKFAEGSITLAQCF